MKQSKAFKQLKTRTQEIFDFAVLITASVPMLKNNLKMFSSGKIKRLPEPDYFEPSVIYELREEALAELKLKGIEDKKIDQLKVLIGIPFNSSEYKSKIIAVIGEDDYKTNRNLLKTQSKEYSENIYKCTNNYQAKLATYLYFSLFSYFEAFISDILIELTNSINTIDKTAYIEHFKVTSIVASKMLRLDKDYDSRKIDQYKKISKGLNADGYVSAEDLMLSSLVDLYLSKVDDLKANDIPSFLEKTFQFKMADTENKTFHSIRANRNSIGHGSTGFIPDLKSVVDASHFLRTLSRKIDSHLILYFFKLKNYKKS